jgi:hypothetical protein
MIFKEKDLANYRLKDESFEQYKNRVKNNNKKIKMYLKGTKIWNSIERGTRIGKFK